MESEMLLITLSQRYAKKSINTAGTSMSEE
jgi:hypothetical protein